MVLDDECSERVAKLVTIPVDTVEYNGAWNGVICFCVGVRDEYKNWLSGCALYVSQDFKIVRVERIRIIETTGLRKMPTQRRTIPFALG
jgi:hypothetical protein